MRLEPGQVLGWRLRQNALDSPATTVAGAVEGVVAVRGWPALLTELAVGVRQAEPRAGSLQSELEAGRLVRSYSFRGGSYVMTPEMAAVVLKVRTATQVWESARFQRQGGFALDDWRPFREAVVEALADGPLTRRELADRLTRIPAWRELREAALGAGSDSLYKPLHWWGVICFGPDRDGASTFRLLDAQAAVPTDAEVDDAGRRAVRLYLAAYGPATADHLHHWLTDGLSAPRRRVDTWVRDLGDAVATVQVGGTPAHCLTSDLDALASAEPSDSVHLLPGFDPWVMNPGTTDATIVDPAHRAPASYGAALVIVGGVVSGTWRARGDEVALAWFGPRPSGSALAEGMRRLAAARASG